MYVPTPNMERVLNDGACLRYLVETGISVQKVFTCFEDNGAAYLVTEFVDGNGMNELDGDEKGVIAKNCNPACRR